MSNGIRFEKTLGHLKWRGVKAGACIKNLFKAVIYEFL
jgi:hypothetical protein